MRGSLLNAWRQLAHSPSRTLVAVTGVLVAVLLMLMQLGFLRAAINSQTALPDRIQSDLVIISAKTRTITQSVPFPRRILYRAPAHPDVAAVQPVALGTAQLRNPWTFQESPVFVYGIELGDAWLAIPGLNESKERLKQADTVLFDIASRPQFTAIGQALARGEQIAPEVNHRRTNIVGGVQVGVNFSVACNLFTSESNFLRLFPDRPAGGIELGLIRAKPGTDITQLRADMQTFLGPEVKVFTKEGLTNAERAYLRENEPIEFIFLMGTAVGFFIGFVIVYQILYTDVSTHLPQFATMKAMGFTDGYLLRMVMQQGFLLALMGFIPGALLSWGLYAVTARATMLPMDLTLSRLVSVFLLTLLMCIISAAFAVRKLRHANPADVF